MKETLRMPAELVWLHRTLLVLLVAGLGLLVTGFQSQGLAALTLGVLGELCIHRVAKYMHTGKLRLLSGKDLAAVAAAGAAVWVVMTFAPVPAGRVAANEQAAVTALRDILSAQVQVATSKSVDRNGNGIGENLYLSELAGGAPIEVQGGKAVFLAPPVLPGGFASVHDGIVTRSGYQFRMFLPDASGAGVPEAPTGGAGDSAPDPSLAEVLWCCYAWPAQYETSGARAFFINQDGVVLASDNETSRYGGNNGPRFDAALLQGKPASLASPTAVDQDGRDGQYWRVIR